MRHARQLLQIHGRGNLQVAERVEILDLHIQLFREKLRRVGHDRCAARQEQPLRGRAALLTAIKLQRLVDLNVQFRHELPRNFGNGRLVWILRLLVRAPEADETLAHFDLLGDSKF